MRMAYLVMALVCFVGGTALLVSQWLHPENATLTIRGTGVSFGWILLVFAAYDLVRWWSRRTVRRRTESVADAWKERRREREKSHQDREIVTDPNFDFKREPPADGPAR
jgi:hypothetical protein